MTDDERPEPPPSLADFEGASEEELAKMPAHIQSIVKTDRAAMELAKIDLMSAELTQEVAVSAFDKCVWGPGPWVDEPDLLMWLAKTPPHYRCQVTRSGFGSLNGYVAIPPGHPAHGVPFHDARLSELPSHGGFTWSGPATLDHWVLGFDCGHGFDIQPALDARLRSYGLRPVHEIPGLNDPFIFPERMLSRYRALPYVRGVVELLAAALAQIAGAGVLPPRASFDDEEPTISEKPEP